MHAGNKANKATFKVCEVYLCLKLENVQFFFDSNVKEFVPVCLHFQNQNKVSGQQTNSLVKIGMSSKVFFYFNDVFSFLFLVIIFLIVTAAIYMPHLRPGNLVQKRQSRPAC